MQAYKHANIHTYILKNKMQACIQANRQTNQHPYVEKNMQRENEHNACAYMHIHTHTHTQHKRTVTHTHTHCHSHSHAQHVHHIHKHQKHPAKFETCLRRQFARAMLEGNTPSQNSLWCVSRGSSSLVGLC